MMKRLFYSIICINVLLWAVPSRAKAGVKILNKKNRLVSQKIDLKMKAYGFKKVYDTKLLKDRIYKDEILVKFKKKTPNYIKERYFLKKNIEVKEKISKNLFLCVPAQENNFNNDISEKALSLVNEFYENEIETELDDEGVERIDINEYKKLFVEDLRSNPDAYKQWHLKNDGVNGLLKGADINIESAWDYTQGEGIKVAVIDTGFDLKHPDINYDGPGYDALNEREYSGVDKKSDEKHGTAVAGIISAKDNKKGVVGVAPASKIIPIRLISDSGMVSVSNIVKAFRKADEMGASIINNSWGTYDPNLRDDETLYISETEKELYEDLAKNGNNGKGILIVFAAGNSGKGNFRNSPEARLKCTLAVGATDSKDLRASYSVYGKELDLVAPGGAIESIITTDRLDIKKKRPNNRQRIIVKGYSKGLVAEGFRGTSAASPVVAGVAALAWSLNPNFTAEEIHEILIESARKDINEKYSFDENGKNPEIGYGRIDAGAAVNYALQLL